MLIDIIFIILQNTIKTIFYVRFFFIRSHILNRKCLLKCFFFSLQLIAYSFKFLITLKKTLKIYKTIFVSSWQKFNTNLQQTAKCQLSNEIIVLIVLRVYFLVWVAHFWGFFKSGLEA